MNTGSITGRIADTRTVAGGSSVGDQLRTQLRGMSPDQRADAAAAGRQLLLAASPCGAWSPGPGFSCVKGTNHQGREGWFWKAT